MTSPQGGEVAGNAVLYTNMGAAPKDAGAHAALGTSLLTTDDFAGAIAAFEKACELASKNEKYQALLKSAKEGKRN